ncbi:MAG: Rieske 2Fe-2S domain-containing protein [Candidatus Woesearchaeota archaeon]|nr:Rieske 2Fe-2S domain-containing protein [Candidatus Woesearchaeota archaeon]
MASIRLGKTELVKEGRSRLFIIDGKKIAVFNSKGKFYAIDSACPHKGVDLVGGEFEGTTVRCSGHGWEFNIETGEGVVMPVCIKTYAIKAEDDEIVIEFP